MAFMARSRGTRRSENRTGRPIVGTPGRVDSRASLSPTAKRILAAARRLVIKGGYGDLTLQAVASAAGEHKSTIAYHFGDKSGLVTSLMESLMRDGNERFCNELIQTQEPNRVSALIAFHRKIAEDSSYWRLLFGLLPEIVRDKKLHANFADLMRSYWEIDLLCLGLRADGDGRAELDRLASLFLAVLEGFALQRQLIGADFDAEAHFATWEGVVQPYLERLKSDRPELFEQAGDERATVSGDASASA